MADIETKPETGHLEDGPPDLKTHDFDDDVVQEATDAEAQERNMSVWVALRTYPWAVFWAVTMSFTIIMEAYDTALVGNLFGVQAFTTKFPMTAPWQAAYINPKIVTIIIGIWINGWASERFGYKWTTVANLVVMIASIFPAFFATNGAVLIVSQLLGGIPWGAFSVMSAAYAVEVSPMCLRVFVLTWIQMCWALGQFVVAGVLYACQKRTDQWAYRIPIAVQWAFPVPLFFIMLFAPESPWWLVRNERIDEAAHALSRLTGNAIDSIETRNTIAMIRRTNQLEVDNDVGLGWVDCFKGTNLRRTLIACLCWMAEPLLGLWVGNQTIYFLELAGLSSTESFGMGLGTNGITTFGVLGSTVILSYFGWRKIFFWGCVGCTLAMLIVGFLGISSSSNAVWGEGALLVIWEFIFNATVAPGAYMIISNIGSTRVRSKTIGIARASYNVLFVATGVALPYMIDVGEANLQGKTGFIFGGISVVVTVLVWFVLPELKGRNAREVDILFARKINARDFTKVVVAPDATE